MSTIIRPLLCALWLLPLAAAAEIYKYVDDNGVTHYTDKPPIKGAKPAALPPLQTIPSSESVQSTTSTPAEKKPPIDYVLAIASPAPEQTFRDTTGEVSVSVSVQPALADGYGLMYYVDGKAATAEPVGSTGFSLSGLERGAHAIAVALVDPDGEEVARAGVNVHLKPPTVKPQVVVPRK